MPTAFADLAARFLEEQYAEHPVRASGMGLTQFDDQLDDLSAAAFERRADAARSWRERFAALDADELTFDEGIDRDLVIAALDEHEIYDEWENWRRHPDIYLNPGMRGVFILFLHLLRPEAEE